MRTAVLVPARRKFVMNTRNATLVDVPQNTAFLPPGPQSGIVIFGRSVKTNSGGLPHVLARILDTIFRTSFTGSNVMMSMHVQRLM